MGPKGNLLTLDQPAAYEIRVCGLVRASWADWAGSGTVLRETREAGTPVSIITGSFDQAALLGLLRRLYALGFPLLSVNCRERMSSAGGKE